ncbi:MAG: DinB family protein [Chloroflexota bacterium]
MLIDFTPVNNTELKLFDFAQQFSVEDLRAATHASLDMMLEIIGESDDAQVTHLPNDPKADDPYAPPEERYLGWSLAHLVAHVTASSEEGAAYSAILARGVAYPREPRLRYETDWHTLRTRAQVLQRIAESRRIRNAALDMWPDAPHLDVFRETSEHALEKNGPSNAKAAFLSGLKHEWAHLDQLRETARQARELASSE